MCLEQSTPEHDLLTGWTHMAGCFVEHILIANTSRLRNTRSTWLKYVVDELLPLSPGVLLINPPPGQFADAMYVI